MALHNIVFTVVNNRLLASSLVHRNRSGSRGPLSRLLGGTFTTLIARSRELANNLIFTIVNTILWIAIAFWNVCADARGLSVTLYWAGSCRTRKGRSTSSP